MTLARKAARFDVVPLELSEHSVRILKRRHRTESCSNVQPGRDVRPLYAEGHRRHAGRPRGGQDSSQKRPAHTPATPHLNHTHAQLRHIVTDVAVACISRRKVSKPNRADGYPSRSHGDNPQVARPHPSIHIVSHGRISQYPRTGPAPLRMPVHGLNQHVHQEVRVGCGGRPKGEGSHDRRIARHTGKRYIVCGRWSVPGASTGIPASCAAAPSRSS